MIFATYAGVLCFKHGFVTLQKSLRISDRASRAASRFSINARSSQWLQAESGNHCTKFGQASALFRLTCCAVKKVNFWNGPPQCVKTDCLKYITYKEPKKLLSRFFHATIVEKTSVDILVIFLINWSQTKFEAITESVSAFWRTISAWQLRLLEHSFDFTTRVTFSRLTYSFFNLMWILRISCPK